jgi:hypothetical protein
MLIDEVEVVREAIKESVQAKICPQQVLSSQLVEDFSH